MSKFFDNLKEKLGSAGLSQSIENLAFDESLRAFRGLDREAKNKKASSLFSKFCTDLKKLEILDEKSVKAVLLGLKKAICDEEEQYLYKLIYEADKLKKQIFAQRAEMKNAVSSGFEAIENSVKDGKFDKKDEILGILNDVLINELDMKGILKESSELAFISVIENGLDIKETAHEVAKNIVFMSINDGEFKKSRILQIAKIVVSRAILVANESKIYASELICGAVSGANDGILKSIEKFKDNLNFAPDEVVANLEDTRSEIPHIQNEFSALLKEFHTKADEPAKSALQKVLDEEFSGYAGKFKKISTELSDQINAKIEELDLESKYKEIAKIGNEKFEELKKEFNEKSSKFIENLDLDEKFNDIKKEFLDFEKKLGEKFNEFKNSDTAKNFNEKAKEFGARAFEAAKNSLKTKKTGEDKKDENK